MQPKAIYSWSGEYEAIVANISSPHSEACLRNAPEREFHREDLQSAEAERILFPSGENASAMIHSLRATGMSCTLRCVLVATLSGRLGTRSTLEKVEEKVL